eukprot:GEMP01030213.1.p1 GENE.GEMP01030213.1~~GEMP01030213.1.p1  ORF type:complete len:373 (+),score=69.26 GEMP01030213.1:76-1194(+)
MASGCDQIQIPGSEDSGVGRLRVMSKLKYEWHVVVGGSPGSLATKFYIRATYSRCSKKVRAYVNCATVYDGTLQSRASGPPSLSIPLDLCGKKATIRYVPEEQGLELVKVEEMTTLASSFVACLPNDNHADDRPVLNSLNSRSCLLANPSDIASECCSDIPLCSDPVKKSESARRNTVDNGNPRAISENNIAGGHLTVDAGAPSTTVEYQSWENVPIASDIAGHVEVRKTTQPIGKLMSNTKMLNTWEFIYYLDDVERLSLVELTYSRRSKKVRVKVNNEFVFDDLLVQRWEGVRFRLDNAKVVRNSEHLYSVHIRYDWESQDFVADYNRDAHIMLRRANMQSEVLVDSAPERNPVAGMARVTQCINRCFCR